MKPLVFFLLVVLLVFPSLADARAQDSNPDPDADQDLCRFIDEDGDGFNDLAPDADGDGIPNGLDPDYEKPEDGDGLLIRWAHAYGKLFRQYFGVDIFSAMNSYTYGPYDGTGAAMGDGPVFGPGTAAGDNPGQNGGSDSGQGVQDRRGGRRK